MKFSIVTSCFNAEKYILETIKSVCEQTEIIKGNCELQYIIIDGNSTDNTNLIIKEFKEKHPNIIHIIEKDEGLYDGLSKGFKYVSGDVMGYLNAGDYFNKSAFSVLKNVFSNKDINWATGLKVIYNQNSEITKIHIPYNYRSNLIRCGAYGKYLPFIQQESTFWRPTLLKDLDIDYFKKLKKSGDMYLWYNFANHNQLYIVNSYLSGFKYHDNQLTFRETGSTDIYLKEAKKFVNKPKIKDFFYIFIDSLPWFVGRNITSIFQKINPNFIDYLSQRSWVKSKNKTDVNNDIYCWVCDYDKTNGEGIIANLFLKSLIKNNKFNKNNIIIKNYGIKLNYNNLKNLNNKKSQNLSFKEKYINPFIGIFFLWYKFFMGHKVVYVNFLPLWNFLIFLLLPPNTILGPITGSRFFDKNVSGWEWLFRKFLMPIQFYLSNLILLFRYEKLIFNTSNLKNILFEKVKNKSKFNFMYNLYEINKTDLNFKKQIDFIFYVRMYPSKGMKQIIKYINALKIEKNIVTVGEKLNIDGIKEYGLVDREIVLDLCKQSKFTIISSENFYSLFSFDCISNGVKVFFNELLDHEKDLVESNKIFPIKIDDFEQSIDYIKKKIS